MSESVLDVARRRADVLDHLRDGPYDKRTLLDLVGASRSTVDRATKELLSQDLIRESSGAFETTVAGVLALETVQEYEADARAIARSAPALRPLWKETPIDVGFLRGADRALVGTVSGLEDRASVRRALERARSVRALVPDGVNVEYLEALYSEAVDGETNVELVCRDSLFDALESSFPGWLHGIVVDGGASIATADVPECGLFVSDFGTHRSAHLLVYDDGRPHAIVRNDSATALEWADDIIETYVERAIDREDRVRSLPDASAFAGVDETGPVLGDRTAVATTPQRGTTTGDGDDGESQEALLGGGYAVDGGRLRTPAFGASGAATVTCWMRPTGSLSSWQLLVKWDELALAFRRESLFGMLYDRDAERRRAVASVPSSNVTVDAWHHVGYVVDGETARLFLDGECVAETADAYPVELDEIGAAIGYHYLDRDTGVHDPQFEGQLTDVRFYEAALDAEAIDELYRTSAPSRDRKGG